MHETLFGAGAAAAVAAVEVAVAVAAVAAAAALFTADIFFLGPKLTRTSKKYSNVDW